MTTFLKPYSSLPAIASTAHRVLTVAEHLYFDQSTLKNSKTFLQLKGESSEASILSLLCAIYQHRAK